MTNEAHNTLRDEKARNRLRNVVTRCRLLLEESVGDTLQGRFGIHSDGRVEDAAALPHLSAEESEYRGQILVHLEHINSSGAKPKEAVAQLIREAAFTHLNRLCAYKMMEARGIIQKSVSQGLTSRGFLFYLRDHPDDEKLWSGGQQDVAYRHYLEWLGGSLSEEIGVLFSPQEIANRLFPPQRVLDTILEQINSAGLQGIWTEDEAIGWVYQYFTPKELREKARKESAAPRNSYEMAFRNQFFTPRYVVEFLTDNTLGRAWYEMRGGETVLKEKCRYLAVSESDITARPKKNPREIRVLDPACGSGHFLLYCFDVLQTIYEEAYEDSDLGPALKEEFPDSEQFRRAVPGLILAHNLHGIDIDLRVTQLAALALWLRAQRAFQEMGLKDDRPKITRTNLVCAEPMPGEKELLEEFIAEELKPHPLGELMGELVRNVFERMKLAGEAGALVRIEDDISGPIDEARKAWREAMIREQERSEELKTKGALFDYTKEEPQQRLIFDVADITNERFWHDAEVRVVEALRDYVRRAGNGEGLRRRLFAEDAEQGFAFIDLCRRKYDVVLMNPPFGDASIPSKPYIDEIYGDTKGDVYKAFVECFQDRLVPGGFLGIISSRTGFFLSGSSDWRERVVLRLYRPMVLADFGMGVLDAMVETAAYVLRSLTEEEDQQLTLQIAKELPQVPTDKKGLFSTRKYEDTRGLKRHQANGELARLQDAGFVKPVKGHFPKWMPLEGEIARAPEPSFSPYPLLVCLRLIGEEDKGRALYESLQSGHDLRRFIASPEDFGQVPNTPFCYWVSNNVRLLFTELPMFESDERMVRQGAVTGDDARHLRAWWEVSPFSKTKAFAWIPYAKGGKSVPFYNEQTLVAGWDFERNTFKGFTGLPHRPSATPANSSLYFRPGLTWSRRSQKGLHLRILPEGSIFADKGSSVLADRSLLPALLGITNSTPFEALITLQMVFGSYEVGVIQRTPIPDLSVREGQRLGGFALECASTKRALDTANETSHVFHLPAPLQVSSDTLAVRVEAWHARVEEAERQLAAHQREIDDIAFCLYEIGDEDRRTIEASFTTSAAPTDGDEQAETDEEAEDEQASADGRQLAADLISYAVGCAYGRWDVRYATGERLAPELPDPFAPLPVCAPGSLTGEDGLPLDETPPGYPLRVDADGILVDDSEHQDDLLARVREVLEIVWPDDAEAREREACDLLGVKTLRDYFRKPGTGGFWVDHVKRYSKSRRKAPIYWLLQSAKKNYAVWLYYHRLDKDLLFKVLLNYVEPKLRLEENKLEQIRAQRAGAGTGDSEARQLEKQLDQQEAFISELRDFRDKLQRAAELNIDPDLDDGVVLNAAPLRELIPWAEAKRYWDELLAGKHAWSSISQQLREKEHIRS